MLCAAEYTYNHELATYHLSELAVQQQSLSGTATQIRKFYHFAKEQKQSDILNTPAHPYSS